jgi:hypothetical protein
VGGSVPATAIRRLLGGIEFAPVHPVGALAAQRRGQAVGGAAGAHAGHGAGAEFDRLGHAGIGPAGTGRADVAFEPDAGMGLGAGRGDTGGDEGAQLRAVGGGETNDVPFAGHCGLLGY